MSARRKGGGQGTPGQGSRSGGGLEPDVSEHGRKECPLAGSGAEMCKVKPSSYDNVFKNS